MLAMKTVWSDRTILGMTSLFFCDMRLVDVLTQNPVQAGDSLIRSTKSRELVRFLPQVSIHRNEIISFDDGCVMDNLIS